MSVATSSAVKRTSEQDSTKSEKLNVEDDFDAAQYSDLKGIIPALQQIRVKAQMHGQKKSEQTISRDSFAKSLSKSSNKRESGTTIVSIMGNDFIVMGADGCSTIDGKIVSLDRMKLVYICDGVFAVQAGYLSDNEVILDLVREQCEAVPPLSLREVISWIIKVADFWTFVTKETNEQPVDSCFIVGGKIPKSTDKIEFFSVENKAGERFRSFASSSPFSLGADSDAASIYIEHRIHAVINARDDHMIIAEHVRDALSFAVRAGSGVTDGALKIIIMHEKGGYEIYSVERKKDGSYGDLVRSDLKPMGL